MTNVDERTCAGHVNRTCKLDNYQMLSSMLTVSLCVHYVMYASGAPKVIQ